MRKLLVGVAAAAAVAGAVSAPTFADTVINGNHSAIVRLTGAGDTKIKDNHSAIVRASGTASEITGNHSAIVRIDGHGASAESVLTKIKGNHSAIVRIYNVCGDINGKVEVSGNHSAIVRVKSNGPCEVASTKPTEPKPETPVEKPAEDTAKEQPGPAETEVVSVTTEEVETPAEVPAELPQTGLDLYGLGLPSGVALLVAAATYALRRNA